MKSYLNVRTGEYPVYEHIIKSRYTNKSWAAVFVPPVDYVEVFDTLTPIIDNFVQKIVETATVNINDKWFKQ